MSSQNRNRAVLARSPGRLVAVLAAGITTFSMSPDLKGILEGVLAFLAFVGFGPVSAPVVPA